MSARDDLCQIIHRGIGLNFEYLAEEILAAGFHRHRIITTAEELDELRYRTVVKDRHGFIHQKFTNNWQEIGDFDYRRVTLPNVRPAGHCHLGAW